MNKIILDKKLYDEALANPFHGSKFPERAALGRAAEPGIVSHFIGSNTDVTYYSVHPTHEILGKKNRHDGVLLVDDTFIAVLEAKLKLRNSVRLSAVEYELMKYCFDNCYNYMLLLAQHVENTMTANWIGWVPMSQEICKEAGTEMFERNDRYTGEKMFSLELDVAKLRPYLHSSILSE